MGQKSALPTTRSAPAPRVVIGRNACDSRGGREGGGSSDLPDAIGHLAAGGRKYWVARMTSDGAVAAVAAVAGGGKMFGRSLERARIGSKESETLRLSACCWPYSYSLKYYSRYLDRLARASRASRARTRR